MFPRLLLKPLSADEHDLPTVDVTTTIDKLDAAGTAVMNTGFLFLLTAILGLTVLGLIAWAQHHNPVITDDVRGDVAKLDRREAAGRTIAHAVACLVVLGGGVYNLLDAQSMTVPVEETTPYFVVQGTIEQVTDRNASTSRGQDALTVLLRGAEHDEWAYLLSGDDVAAWHARSVSPQSPTMYCRVPVARPSAATYQHAAEPSRRTLACRLEMPRG